MVPSHGGCHVRRSLLEESPPIPSTSILSQVPSQDAITQPHTWQLTAGQTEIAVKAAAEAVAKMGANNSEAERHKALVHIRATREALYETPPFMLPMTRPCSSSAEMPRNVDRMVC